MDTVAVTPRIDVAFPLAGDSIPRDHGYALFSAMSRVLGEQLHGADWLAVHPVRGTPATDGMLVIDARRSQLRLRLVPGAIPKVLALAGKRLELAKQALRVGVPNVFGIDPSPALYSRAVVIKFKDDDIREGPGERFVSEELFRTAVERQLTALDVAARVEVGGKREVRVRDKRVVGYAVTLRDLSDEGSLRVQYEGIGGRQRFGCGVFTPHKGA
jgi:CRISPR-associated protein Cas6